MRRFVIRHLKKVYHFLYDLKYMIPYKVAKKQAVIDGGILLIMQDLKKQGSQKLLLSIAKELVEQEESVCVVSIKNGAMWRQINEKFPLFVTSEKKLSNLFEYLKETHNYNRAICNTVVTGKCTQMLKKNGYEVVSLVHEMEKLIRNEGFLEECDYIAKYADKIVFPSTYVKESFSCCVAVDYQDKTYIKNQGLFNEKLKNLSYEDSRRRVERKYGIQDIKFIVLNVANAEKRKGLDMFIDLAYLCEEDDRYEFIWVGNQPKALCEAIIAEKSVEYQKDVPENLRIIDYIDDINVLNDLYCAANVFFLSSREDPFPSVVLDSMCAKTPVIAFDKCGGFVDVIKNRKTGFLIEPFDIEAVYDKIKFLSENAILYNEMEEACFQVATKNSFYGYCKFLRELFS